MNNPRRYEASRGDCFYDFFWPLLISLLLHIVVLGNFAPGRNTAPSILPVERDMPVSSLHIVRIVPHLQSLSQAQESYGRRPQEQPTERKPESADFLRSTAKILPNAGTRATNVADPAESDGDLRTIDMMEASEYRLALARALVRLRPDDGSQPVGVGEIFLELIGRQGPDTPILRMSTFNVQRAESERWHMLMQAAVEQTPIPASWSGRPFKLSLKLYVVPIHSAEGSACNSCS